MKTVASFFRLSDAAFAQSLLVGDGIAAELQNVESSVNLVGGLPSIQVIVPDADFERASIAIRPLGLSRPIPEKAMIISERELSVFRAIVKGIGVYQLVTGLGDFAGIVFEKADIKHVAIGSASHQGEYLAWGIYHFCVALVLLFGTDLFCRLAFSSRASRTMTEEEPAQLSEPRPASGSSPAGQEPRHP